VVQALRHGKRTKLTRVRVVTVSKISEHEAWMSKNT
jgi:hypothetical protein